MAEKMKEIVDLANDLDDLDKEAWVEIISHAENETMEKLETAVTEGEEVGLQVWEEILPLVKLVRLGLASDTISRVDRCGFVSVIIREISGLLSPVELAGICFAEGFRCLCSSRGGRMPIVLPIPLGAMAFGKKDESKTIV